jgi:hypothetical protein
MRVFFFFFGQFCDVSEVTMIHKKDLANFGYKLKYESRILQTSFNIFGYILESCTEIWQKNLILFSSSGY